MGNKIPCCAPGYRTTAEEHVKRHPNALVGQTWIVTGGTNGIGYETARALLVAKATVVITGREQKRCEEAAARLRETVEGSDCKGMECDLSSFESIRRFVAAFEALKVARLGGLILNAGVMATGYRLTKEGVDIQMGTNHVGHFLLTSLLTDSLIASAPSRVVVVSGELAFNGSGLTTARPLDMSLLPHVPKEKYTDPYFQYQQSKLANILYARTLSAKLSRRGVTAYSLHPGVIPTDLGVEHHGKCGRNVMGCCCQLILKSIPEGSATSVYCAIEPDIENHSGGYFSNSRLAPAEKLPAYVTDDKVAEELWAWTEKFISEHPADGAGAAAAGPGAAAAVAPRKPAVSEMKKDA